MTLSRCRSGMMSHSDMICRICEHGLECKHPYMKDRPVCLYGANPYAWSSRCSAIIDDEHGQLFCFEKRKDHE